MKTNFVLSFSLGLAGLADPLRASVPAAVRECQTAGIRVVMITGDYPITARTIAPTGARFRPNRIAVGMPWPGM